MLPVPASPIDHMPGRILALAPEAPGDPPHELMPAMTLSAAPRAVRVGWRPSPPTVARPGRPPGSATAPAQPVARHPRVARHRPAGGAGRRALVRPGPQRARLAHRAARRHAVGHLRAVPQDAVALARALGHEPRSRSATRTSSSRARCWCWKRSTAAPGCAWPSGAGQVPTNTVKLSPQRAQRVARQRRHRGHPAAPDRPLPQRGGGVRDQRTRRPRRASSPRRKAACMVSRGETAYVRGDLGGARDFRLFRQLQPAGRPAHRRGAGLRGPLRRHRRIRARRRPGAGADGKSVVVPATFMITSTRLEAGVGDRLSPVPQQELVAYVPHPPAAPVDGHIVSIYGEGLRAGQNQVVALNRGKRDGIERGHVLALWRAGIRSRRHHRRRARGDAPARRTARPAVRLPRLRARVLRADPHGAANPSAPGDRFTQP